jgi:hypothetical protein
MNIGDYVLIKVGKHYNILGFVLNFTKFYMGQVVKLDSNSNLNEEVEKVHLSVPNTFFNTTIRKDKIIEHKILI